MVDLPLPMGPVSSTSPLFSPASRRTVGDRPRVPGSGISPGITRTAMAGPPKSCSRLTRSRHGRLLELRANSVSWPAWKASQTLPGTQFWISSCSRLAVSFPYSSRAATRLPRRISGGWSVLR